MNRSRLALLPAIGAALLATPVPVLSAPAKLQAQAVEAGVPDGVHPIDVKRLEEADFPLLSLLDRDADARAALGVASGWRTMMAARRARIAAEGGACGDALCRIRAFRWQEGEKAAAGAALVDTLARAGVLARVTAKMRASGDHVREAGLADRDLVAAAWRAAVAGQDQILDTYGLGATPRYPQIDAMTFDPASELWDKLAAEAMNQIMGGASDRAASASADPGYRLALALLYLNERENAGSYPDLDSHWNAAARAALNGTDWAHYRYSAILVLGDGPDTPGQRLGSFGKLRVAHAARLYRAGLAPFLIVSGGNVHPARTPFNEAEEMRRELIARYGVPESAILMEPHARHTTTNFRNAARLMIRYGFPSGKPALATTSAGHSLYAAGADFDRKAIEELGYVPRRTGERISPFDFTFSIDPQSTQRDVRDPLDP